MVAHTDDMLVRTVLGSCVAVIMYDRQNCFGGINHFIWPKVEKDEKPSVMYGNVAIPALYRMLTKMGASKDSIEAQLFGGGRPSEKFSDKKTLGDDNVKAAKSILKRMRVPVFSEDVGGCKGRKIVYNTKSNEALVVKVDNLRATDWYDYDQDVDWDRV
jgi:chemotaxis protein CheD